MINKEIKKKVFLPETTDVLKKYSRYTSLATGEGRFLLDLIMQPDVVLKAQVLAEFGLPSVLAVAEPCKQAIEANAGSLELGSFTKQFIGAAICVLMEANGYKKTGTKKSVPHPSFSTGEFYERVA